MEKEYWKKYFEIRAERENGHQQVERTINKKPMHKAKFNQLLKYIEKNMEIKSKDTLLDLCCGNGMITSYLAAKCKQVVGVDFTEKLINGINKTEHHDKIIGVVDDITKIKFKESSFDKVLIYFSIQHISPDQTIKLFKSVYNWLKKDGLFYIGEIPDSDRIWNFFDNLEREGVYFNGIENNEPVVGHWYSKNMFIKLGKYAGFKESKVIDQPKDFLYAHYRFDMVLKK